MVVIHRIGGGNPNLMDRRLLQDLKMMREAKHDNLNGFIGISLKPDNIFTLMSFASRGTLQYLLQEMSQISMDFKLSLLHDIAQGLNYLHSSEIGKFIHFIFDEIAHWFSAQLIPLSYILRKCWRCISGTSMPKFYPLCIDG